MIIIIKGIVVAIDKVPATNIIDITIVIIIDTIIGNLTGVTPDITDDIFMVIVQTGIDHRNDNIAAGLCIPGFRCINIGIGSATSLTGIVQAIKLGKAWIIGNGCCSDNIVWFCIEYLAVAAQAGDGIFLRHAGLHIDQGQAVNQPKAFNLGTARCLQRLLPCLVRG